MVTATATEGPGRSAWPNQPSHPSSPRWLKTSSAERTIPPTELMPLWLALHQWIEIIEHFVLQRSRRFVNHRNYDRLYKMLVQTCRMRWHHGRADEEVLSKTRGPGCPLDDPEGHGVCGSGYPLEPTGLLPRGRTGAAGPNEAVARPRGKRGVGDKLAGSGLGDHDVCGRGPVALVGLVRFGFGMNGCCVGHDASRG